MQLTKIKMIRIFLFSLCAVFLASGCASFAGRELPIFTNNQLAAPDKKMSVTYDIKAFGPRGENAMAASNLDKEIQKVLSASPLFAEIKAASGQGDYHYSFVFRNEGVPSEGIAFLNGFVSGFTFGVIPAFARDIFILTVEVKQGDRVLKTYTYKDHMDTWIQLFLVFLTPLHWPTDVSTSTIDNMLMNFIYEFGNDVRSGVYLARQN